MFKDNDQEENNLKNQFAEKISPQVKEIGLIDGYLVPNRIMRSVLAENGFTLKKIYSFSSGEPLSMSVFTRE